MALKRTTVVEVPVANKEGKSVRLTLDYSAGEVKIELPVMLKAPAVDVNELARAVYDLQEEQRR